MKYLGIGVAALVIWLLFLLVSLPARFALQFAPLPPNVAVGGVEGSIWQGSIDALLVDDMLLRDVQWQLRPLALLRGQLAADIQLVDHLDNIAVGNARVLLSRQQVEVEQLQVEARLVDLAAYAPEPSPFPLRGDVRIELAQFTLGQPICDTASGRVELIGGAIQVGQNWESLGVLSANIGCEDGWLSAELGLNTMGLTASMRASLAGAQGEFQIQPSSEAPRTIRNIVSLLPEQGLRPQRFQVRF